MPLETYNQNSEKRKSTITIEKALIASEIRYRRLFESAQDGILILDAEMGMIVDVNSFLINLLGYPKEKFLKKAIWEIGFFKDILENKEKFLELQQKKYVRYEDLPLETTDGRKIHVEFVSNVYLAENKKVIQCNIRDITERKLTEEVLHQKTALLEAQLNSSIDGIIVVDNQGKKILQNQRTIDLWKIPQHIADNEDDHLQVQHVMQMTKNPEKFVRKITDLYEHPDIKSFEETELVDGTVLERYSAPVLDKFGKNYGRIWIFHDITERKLAEEFLKETQKIAMLGSYVLDIKTGEWRSSEVLDSIFGIEADYDKSVKGWADIIHPDWRQVTQEYLANIVIGSKKKFDKEYKIIRKNDKAERWVHGMGKLVLNGENEPIQMLGTIKDITDSKLADIELNAALKKATESDRLKSAFLANMSHEIRTPMNGILGFTQLLKTPKLTGEEQQAFIDIIEKSGARMLNIINDIINISKIESGQIEISISDVNINELARDIFNFFKPEAEKKELNFSYKNMLSESEINTKTDKAKVKDVLTNLVRNALKFTQTGSIEMGCEKKDKFLEFFVKDTGPGIPQEQKEIIFERFRQGSDTLTRNYEGAGLGLAISKAYVEILGGKIWIESNKEQGSTFCFTIPYLNGFEEKEQIQPVAEKKIKPIRKLKILVVEDDDTSRIFLELIIKPLSSVLFQAKTGLEAIEICRNNPDIDLVLMDIQMPVMNGHEATRKIRIFNNKVVIIAQTAFALSGDREKALEAGCNDYIIKPIKRVDLIIMIEKHSRLENL